MSRYQAGLKTEQKILKILAINKEFCQYDFPKQIEKDYHTVLRHLKYLEEKDFIKLLREEKSAKKGKERKIYGITLFGLVYVLFFDGDLWNQIDDIARQKTSNLPLIFGKWNFFEEKGIKQNIIARLQGAVFTVYKDIDRVQYLETGIKNLQPEEIPEEIVELSKRTFGDSWKKVIREMKDVRKAIYELAYSSWNSEQDLNRIVFLGIVLTELFLIPFSWEDEKKFLSILKEDKDLRQYIDEQFDKLEKERESQLIDIRSRKEYWQKLKVTE